MQVTQVFFSDNNTAPPDEIVDCMNTVKRYVHIMPHVIYNLDSAREFLLEHMGYEIVTAFDKLNPYAYKADLFRYCALFVHGGWYFDCTVKLNTTVFIPDNCNSVSFRDFPLVTNSAWSVWNGALFSRPNHKAYELAINSVLANCKSEYYGTCNLSPTGPVLLGRAFASINDDLGNLFFNCVHLTPGYRLKNPALVLSDGTIFAYLKNTGAVGLAGYNTSGTNNYSELYDRREVYKK